MSRNATASGPRRILVIAGYAPSLVGFRGVLLQAMQTAGWEVHTAAPEMAEHAEVSEQLKAWGIVVHDVYMQRTGMNPLDDLATLQSLYGLMRHLQPNTVLAYTIKPVIYGVLAAWLARVPRRFALITGLGYAFTGEAKGKRAVVLYVARKLYEHAMKRSHKAFFQNPDDQALFIEQGILPKHIPSVVINGSGVDVEYFAREKLPVGTPSFLLIARLIGDKGVRQYAEAAKKLHIQYPDAVFQLVGEFDENPDSITRDELNSWTESGAIDYLGCLADVRPALAEASVFVLPSYYREGTPRTILEAMSMGRPVITTDTPGCRETVIDGDNGFLILEKSVDALVDAMQQFIEHPELMPRMGQRSREIAEEKYDVHKVNAVMLKEMGVEPSERKPSNAKPQSPNTRCLSSRV